MSRGKPPLVGIFVEGNLRDRTRDSVSTLWKKLAEHCKSPAGVIVYGIDKSQIVALKPAVIPKRTNAVSIQSQRESLDIAIDRAYRSDGITHALVAFDAWPPNVVLERSGRRGEIEFLLRGLQASDVLAKQFRDAAGVLADRYAAENCLDPRSGKLECLEILYMEPMFESLFVADEATVRNALGHKSFPKDWPKFKNPTKTPDKHVIDPAVKVAHKDVHKKMGGGYLDRKTAWALRIVETAAPDAALWRHEITSRLCRILCNVPSV